MKLTLGERIEKYEWYINNLAIAHKVSFETARDIFKHGFEEAEMEMEKS